MWELSWGITSENQCQRGLMGLGVCMNDGKGRIYWHPVGMIRVEEERDE